MAKKRKNTRALQISALEADIAYFDARLAMIGGESLSHYQEAQAKAYRELLRILSERLQSVTQPVPVIEGVRVEEIAGPD